MKKGKEQMHRKLITVTDSLWSEVDNFRWAKKMETEGDALRALITKGLESYEAERRVNGGAAS